MTFKRPLPVIKYEDTFDQLCEKLAGYLCQAIRKPTKFEDLGGTSGASLRQLCLYLTDKVYHPATVAALLVLAGHFSELEDDDVSGVNATRAAAGEYVALRCVSQMSDRELIDCLLVDVLGRCSAPAPASQVSAGSLDLLSRRGAPESSPLLGYGRSSAHVRDQDSLDLDGLIESPSSGAESVNHLFSDSAEELNALEIAAVSNAKRFLGDRSIQRIITAIWDGDIVFWSDLSSTATKHAHLYRVKDADPYARLRVPKYLKAFEVLFFIAFLVLYYVVLVQKPYFTVTWAEILLYLWLFSFAYNELGEVWDAGTAFYLSDFWALWDLAIVASGAAFLICRVIGLVQHDQYIIDIAFDILAMEALFLIPRFVAALTEHSWQRGLTYLEDLFATQSPSLLRNVGMSSPAIHGIHLADLWQLPCLKEMTKDFVKFLSLVVILYLGFLTTFSLLARGYFTFRQMSWILIKVFFGSSYLGFDVAEQISPVLGPPLMLLFVCLTNILLITSLISILSNSLTKIIDHAADEYKFVSSVYVLEASTSNRLTYFLPPLNLVPLVLRPTRLFLSNERLREIRILLLKITHAPHILTIQAYERLRRHMGGRTVGTLPTSVAPDARGKNKGYVRASKRFSTPRPFSAANLRSTRWLQDEDGLGCGEQPSLTEALEAIRGLEAKVGRLSRQIDRMSS